MASSWRRFGDRLRAGLPWNGFRRKADSSAKTTWRRYGALGLGAAALGGVTAVGGYALVLSAEELELHPPLYPWSHNPVLSSLDHNSIRRGYQVYREVCAACHSLRYIAFRHLVDVCHTDQEMKDFAGEVLIPELDDDGNEITRPGKLFDYHQDPYPNDLAARAANNGALPPDLSFVVLAREGNEDYIYSYLTGYRDPPEGIEVPDGQYYNTYFPGQLTSMAPPLFNGMITYEDGTPASASQMAKDVCTFLRWTADPKHDERKHFGMKAGIIVLFMFLAAFYAKRHFWMAQKTRKILYREL